jgi:hypothetical protein
MDIQIPLPGKCPSMSWARRYSAEVSGNLMLLTLVAEKSSFVTEIYASAGMGVADVGTVVAVHVLSVYLLVEMI